MYKYLSIQNVDVAREIDHWRCQSQGTSDVEISNLQRDSARLRA